MIQEDKEKQKIVHANVQEQYLQALESESVPVGVVILEGEKRVITFVNPIISKLWGRTKEQVINRPLFEALPELADQVFEELLQGVYTTGIPYFGTEVPAVFVIDGKKEEVYFNFVYSPIRNEQGTITGIFVTALDVTAQVNATRHVAEEQKRLYDFLHQSPAAIAVLRGKDHVYEIANELYQKLVGKTAEQLIGIPGRIALPELANQGIWNVFDTVYATGETFYGNEFPILLDRRGDGQLEQGYFNFIAQAIRNELGQVERIFIHASEVTEQVKARKKVEESEEILEQRRRLYEAVTASTPDLIYVFDLNYRFIYANEALLKMWGRTWDESNGKRLLEVGYKPWHAEMHEREIDQIVATKKSIRGEVAFPHATLGRRIYDYIFTPVLNSEGIVEAVAGTTRDITELKQTEEALQKVTAQQEETLALLESLLKNAPVGFAFFDKEHRYIRINESLAKMDGIPAKDHIRKTVEEVLPENASIVALVLEKVRETKEAVLNIEMTGETLKESGETRYWLTGFYPVFIGKSRDVDYVGAVVVDITDMKKLEQQKDEFLAVASHELKTPVTSIKAYTQVLQKQFKNKGDIQSFELLTKMNGQINKLITLIADLLDVSRMQAGKLQLRLNTFDFNELVMEVTDEIQRTATQHTILTELTKSKIVYGDRDRIGQVITNLLTNAVKYSPLADRVVVKTRAEQEAITLYVQDFGLGIPKEKQEKVFEQFYRVEGRKENIYPGLGLGLYISSEIICRHGGTIGVESVEGKGSTFYFTLPTQKRPIQQEDMMNEEAIQHE